MMEFWTQHQYALIVFQFVLAAIALSNTWALRRLGSGPLPTPLARRSHPPPVGAGGALTGEGAGSQFPRVSILVPARDEAANIGPCVRSLLAQEYPDFEVLAVDDDSHDETGEILAAIAGKDTRLRAWRSAPLPAGWLGKHWACHQLAQAATGELLVFTDADTRWHPRALSDAVAMLAAEDADLLSALPRQETGTWGERLTVPFVCWSLYCFLPLAVAHPLQWPPLSATIGQFMLFRREAYQRCGGYAAVRAHVADDLALGRRIIAHGRRWRLVDAGERVHCRMYRGFREAFAGFSKNQYAAFDYKPWLYVPIWAWIGLVFLEPPLIVLAALAGAPLPAGMVELAAGSMALAAALWALVDVRFGFPVYLAFAYPLRIAVALAVVARSLVLTLTGRATWKGRALAIAKDADRHQYG